MNAAKIMAPRAILPVLLTALAMSLGAAFQLVALLWVLRKRYGRLGMMELGRSAIKSAAASLIMGGFCWWFIYATAFSAQGTLGKALLLFADIGLGIVLYALVSFFIGVKEIREWKLLLTNRFKPQTSQDSEA